MVALFLAWLVSVMPTNTTPATAIDIPSLPYTLTLDVATGIPDSIYTDSCHGTDTRPLWWKITQSGSNRVIGVRVRTELGDDGYEPVLSVWSGTLPSLTQVELDGADVCAVPNRTTPTTPVNREVHLAFLMDVGATYYIQVNDQNGAPVPVADRLTFEALAPYTLPTPRGSLLVLNDTRGFPATVLSASNGRILKNAALPASEFGAWCGKVLCIPQSLDRFVLGQQIDGLTFWNPSLKLITENTDPLVVPAGSVFFWIVSTNYVDRFYVSRRFGPPVNHCDIITLATDGSLLPDTWSLPANSLHMQGLGISRDGTIAYYYSDLEIGAPIHRFDLVNNVPLSDLRGAVNANEQAAGRDILVMSDDTILCVDQRDSALTDRTIRRYAPDGTLLNTYPLPADGSSPPRIAIDPVDASFFWVMHFPLTVPNFSRFTKIKTSDGSTLVTFDVDYSEAGEWKADDVLGPSQSCPLLIMPGVDRRSEDHKGCCEIREQKKHPPHKVGNVVRPFDRIPSAERVCVGGADYLDAAPVVPSEVWS